MTGCGKTAKLASTNIIETPVKAVEEVKVEALSVPYALGSNIEVAVFTATIVMGLDFVLKDYIYTINTQKVFNKGYAAGFEQGQIRGQVAGILEGRGDLQQENLR